MAQPLPGEDYFLKPGGDDAKDGKSWENAWATLGKANYALCPGDTVTVANGTYAGLIFPSKSGDLQNGPITYRAENRHGAIITGGPPGGGRCLYLPQRSHIVVDGFHLAPQDHRSDQPVPSYWGWIYLSASSHCTIANLKCTNATGAWGPVTVSGSNLNRFENLQVWTSLRADWDDPNPVTRTGHTNGNLFWVCNSDHNLFQSLHVRHAGHCPFALRYDCDYNVIRQCVFDGRWGRNFEFFSSNRVLIEQCLITNGFDGSGSADGGAKALLKDSIFRHNVIYRNSYVPVVAETFRHVEWGRDLEVARSRFYHNTWALNQMAGLRMQEYQDEPDKPYVTGNVFLNNILAYNDPDGDGLALLLRTNINDTEDSNVFECNNLFGRAVGDRTVWYRNVLTRAVGVKAYTVSEAQQAFSHVFINNIDVVPGFIDPNADNYTLNESSACVDAGQSLTTTVNKGCSGRRIEVRDARWFYDGFGIPGEVGDWIRVGDESARVAAVSLSYGTVTVDRDIAWEAGAPVSLAYAGAAPDLGAYERGAEGEDWYAGPRPPEGLTWSDLRIDTMETSSQVLVRTDFEPANWLDWCYLWNFERQTDTASYMDDTTAHGGQRSIRVEATGAGAALSCDLRPYRWNIDRYPIVFLAYRIPPGVPVGLWVKAFSSETVGDGRIYLAGSAAVAYGSFPTVADPIVLTDDDQWHSVAIDVRTIRTVELDGVHRFSNVSHLELLGFCTQNNGDPGDRFWFDDFRIEPAP